MSAYTGWGGLSNAFKKDHKWNNELLRLLMPDEYAAAEKSSLDAYFTPDSIIRGIYAGIERLGVSGDAHILEPAAGIGRFMGYAPEGINGNFTAVEPDSLSSRISNYLYPEAEHINYVYEKSPLPGDFDVAIGNPPYGEERMVDPLFPDLNGGLIHNYFMGKSIDLLRDGGIAAFVVTSSFLDGRNEELRAAIAQKADFLGAVRLPA